MCDTCNEQFYLDTFGEQGATTMEPNLQPDHCEDFCATCKGRIPEGQAIPPDPEHARSWRMVFCTEECKAMQASIRL